MNVLFRTLAQRSLGIRSPEVSCDLIKESFAGRMRCQSILTFVFNIDCKLEGKKLFLVSFKDFTYSSEGVLYVAHRAIEGESLARQYKCFFLLDNRLMRVLAR